MDVFYTMLWVGFFQTIISVLFLPFNSLPFLGSQAIPIRELPRALLDGTKCLFGVDTIVTHCYLYDPIENWAPCDTCQDAWSTVAVYIVVNVAFNIFAILMIREGSASLYIIIMTLRLPLGNMAFYMNWIMGDETQPFDPHDLSGLTVILIGLVIYRWQRSPEAEDADAPYIVTSILTINPGVGEPAVTQIQRRPLAMQRTIEGIRGQLYTRLGMRPSKYYIDPEMSSADVVVDRVSPSAPRRGSSNFGYGSMTPAPSVPVGFGVSPIARSAPLYAALLARSTGSQVSALQIGARDARVSDEDDELDDDDGSASDTSDQK